jgi:hypothetical protein
MSTNFQSWFSIFQEQSNDTWGMSWKYTKWGWMGNDGRILADGFSKTYPFNEEFEWFAKFKKWKVYGYIDTKWIKWDDIQDRNWSIYLKIEWKWYLKNLIKI